MIGLSGWLGWLLNVLIGLGFLTLLAVAIFLVLRWRARYERDLEEADRRYAESEAERKQRESRWSS